LQIGAAILALVGSPEVSLALAREKAKDMRLLIQNGKAPLVVKKENQQSFIKSHLQQVRLPR
jgi:hypothetical protein